MRIDKFLWMTRYYKSRSLATEAGKKNRLILNGEVVKPSKEVMIGDEIQLKKHGITYSLKVLQLPKNRIGAKLKTLYVRDTTPQSELDQLKTIRETQNYYRFKGLGRPTKKDRRDLDDFIEDLDE